MINFNCLTSIETYLSKSRSILEEDITPSLIEYFVTGYQDSINGNLVNETCCRVDLITSLEEFVYVMGHRIGNFDFKIGHTNDCNILFSEEYKKAIKMNLMAFNIDESINTFNQWLMHV